jgi:hypothetical protein
MVLLDSGADERTFPLSFAQQIGLDSQQMPAGSTAGVGSVANLTYYAPIEVRVHFAGASNVSRIAFTTQAGFTAGLDAQGIGLLGQSGFFENFLVEFNHKTRSFSIEV